MRPPLWRRLLRALGAPIRPFARCRIVHITPSPILKDPRR